MLELIFPLFGILICALATLQLVQWSAGSMMRWHYNRQQFEASQAMLRERLDSRQAKQLEAAVTLADGSWKGFRDFVVQDLVPETEHCTSVYLRPSDGKPIAEFLPGQHLAILFPLTEGEKPAIRCYSLSSTPNAEHYRITVKRCPPPVSKPDSPAGKISAFVNDQLRIGDRLKVKSPSGGFVLEQDDERPLVLLAGGIGITPLLSMIESEVQRGSQRAILLVYGVRNKGDHAFRERLRALEQQHAPLHVINVYSRPESNAVKGVDYHLKGYVSVESLKQILPHNQCRFYLCGPPRFMESIYPDLLEWGVAEDALFYEAFGPATVRRPANEKKKPRTENESGATVEFTRTGTSVSFSNHESILELAGQHGIEIESGCGMGNCGTCETRLLDGDVIYPEGESPDVESGHCLVCIAKPSGHVVLEA